MFIRHGQVARLKPEKIEEYIALHENVWKEILEIIEDCNLRNYSIYYKDGQVFSYYEYTGEDYEKDLQKMEANPLMQEWWTHTKPCFATCDEGVYYEDMREIFYNK